MRKNKKMVALICMVIFCVACLCGCGDKLNNKETFTLSVKEGEVLHVDLTVSTGEVHLTVTDGDGVALEDATIEEAYNYGVNVYADATYTVVLDWTDARGTKTIYTTKDGEKVNTFSGQE